MISHKITSRISPTRLVYLFTCIPVYSLASIQLPRKAYHLQLPNRFRDLDITRTSHRAVEDRVAARQSTCLADDLHPFRSGLVAAIEDETMGSHKGGGTEIIVTAPVGGT